jgi:serine/threonine protein kinase
VKKPIPFGKYYLLDRISVGGMAEVFKAKAFGVEGFERLIAVKRILPSIAEDEEFITMFIDEAKIAVQLQHANIAQIFDLGKVGDSYFIALEYVPGKDLRSIFDKLRKSSQAIPIPMAGYVTMKVCEGLDYAHNKKDAAGRDLNLVHRDVSPQNVLISYDGEVKIIDFGIAKAAGKAGKTQAGILKGKFGYMSPEQVRGLPLDRRSDIFSVGICLWEMVTGERLFVGESDFSTLEKVRNVEITPPSSYNKRIPEDLEKIVLKALSREVEDRYQSAMDLHDDLQSWMYTSGNFFARKDLGSFMHEVFREDIDREFANTEGGADLVRPSSPPPKVSVRPAPGPRVSPKPGAPPPPPRAASLPPGRVPPPAGYAPAGQQPIMPVQPSQGRKRTMLGMPSAVATKPPTRPVPLQPPTASSRAGKSGAPNPAVSMGEWDEDEPPTNIYSKEAAAEMAKAALAHARGGQTAPSPNATAPAPNTSAPGPNATAPATSLGPPMPKASNERVFNPFEPDTSMRRSGKGWIALAIVLVALIAGAGGIFFLSIKAQLQISVTPETDLQVIIDGSRILPGSASPFLVTDLDPGFHTVTIRSDGYKEQTLHLNLGRGEKLRQQVQLSRDETGFFLETDPPGASVWVDEIPQDDKTPITVLNLSPGVHTVRIAKGDKYAQDVINVVVQSGNITQVPKKTLDLKEIEVTFRTEPEGARAVLVTGSERQNLGTTPATASLYTSKSYKILFAKAGYSDMEIPVEYPAGQEKVTLDPVPLAPKDEPAPRARVAAPRQPVSKPAAVATSEGGASGAMGSLSVQTKPWSKVYINGQFIKNTPLVNHPLKPGTYQITVENPSYNVKKDFKVTIKAGKPTTVVHTLI